MAGDLARRLRHRIERDGPMPFADWMESCLYDPEGGYYMRAKRKTGPGAEADFATSPTLHPFFARCVAREGGAVWEDARRPPAFDIVEFGGGEGDLARDALAWADRNGPREGPALRWTHVERSGFHRRAQAGDPRITWADAMPDVHAGLVVANEFLDALPVHLLEWRSGAWQEVCVDTDGQTFVEALWPASAASLAAVPDVRPEEGMRVVANPGAARWLRDVAARMNRGRVLVADYGDAGARLWRESANGTVRGFRGQAPHEPLVDPGTADITSSIDFGWLAAQAARSGLKLVSMETQEAFLLRHGVLDALNAVDRTTKVGASDYLRLRQLVLPTGLGTAFKVAVFEKA